MQESNQKIDQKEIASQLSFPKGDNGIQVANAMNKTNLEMILSSIEALNIQSNNRILEIGHGNCAHFIEILEKEHHISYTGLEVSETMKMEAEQINKEYLKSKKAEFHLYDGEKIPFTENYFDKIFTVNTLYFWKNPSSFLSEIYRVLKPNGLFVLTFAIKEFMEGLPFVNERFELYNEDSIKELIGSTEFEIDEIFKKRDNIKSKLGDLSNRDYLVVIAKKNS